MKHLRFAIPSIAIFAVMAWSIGFWNGGRNDRDVSDVADPSLTFLIDHHSNPETYYESELSNSENSEPSNFEGKSADAFRIAEWEMQEFRRAHGFFTAEELDEYELYSNEAILNLVNAGDLKAIHEYASRALDRGDLAAAIEINRLAAVFGSTNALGFLASYHFSRGTKDNAEGVDEHLLGLAYQEARAIRGDLNGLRIGLIQMKEAGITLDEEQKAFVTDLARYIYDQLEHERMELGMPDFENEVNPYTLMSIREQFTMDKNPTGWGARYYR